MYRLAIWLIAVAFVFNGAGSLAWADLPAAPALAAHAYDGAGAAARNDAHSHRIADAVISQLPDNGQTPGRVGNCAKCCATCGVASLVPDVTVTAVMFSDAGISFYIGQRDLVGHLVAIDPDIPKAVVKNLTASQRDVEPPSLPARLCGEFTSFPF